MYKLSSNDALSHFHRVILVSSPLDTYVPVYSARIQVCGYLIYFTYADWSQFDHVSDC